jgi:AcrR family transcriptional regulator
MSGRRTDTRQRIQQVALELFSERGYDKTSLRELADRLEITRPALYYHFKAKEDILTSVIDDLNASMDELATWAKNQPLTPEGRLAVLVRVAALLNDQWRPLLRFAQVNQSAMREVPAGSTMQDRMMAMISMLADPDSPPTEQFEAWLAVIALLIGTMPFIVPSLTDQQRADVSLDVAKKLLTHEPGSR